MLTDLVCSSARYILSNDKRDKDMNPLQVIPESCEKASIVLKTIHPLHCELNVFE